MNNQIYIWSNHKLHLCALEIALCWYFIFSLIPAGSNIDIWKWHEIESAKRNGTTLICLYHPCYRKLNWKFAILFTLISIQNMLCVTVNLSTLLICSWNRNIISIYILTHTRVYACGMGSGLLYDIHIIKVSILFSMQNQIIKYGYTLLLTELLCESHNVLIKCSVLKLVSFLFSKILSS